MALQLKYEVRQLLVDAQGSAVTYRPEVLITTYDDDGNIVKQRSADTPEYAWSQLPQVIKDDILKLRDDTLAALKTKYGTEAVAMIAPAAAA